VGCTRSFLRSGAVKGGLVGLVAGAGIAWWFSARQSKAEEKTALNPKEFVQFPLEKKTQVTSNTAIYRFTLPSSSQTLNLPVASFIVVQADVPGENEPVIRPYTPITYDEKGYFELMVKSYPNGKVSKKIGELKIGDKIKVKGPIEKLQYKPNMKKKIAMIAGGSGVTPMLQIIHEVLKNPNDKTELTLIFGNQTSQDILLKERLDKFQSQYKNFKVHYIIDKAEPGWKGPVGYITDDFAKKILPPPSDDMMVLCVALIKC